MKRKLPLAWKACPVPYVYRAQASLVDSLVPSQNLPGILRLEEATVMLYKFSKTRELRVYSCLDILSDFDRFGRRVGALVRAGTSKVVRAHSVLSQGDPVLVSLVLPLERAGRFAAI